MKKELSVPVVIGIVAVVLIVAGALYWRSGNQGYAPDRPAPMEWGKGGPELFGGSKDQSPYKKANGR